MLTACSNRSESHRHNYHIILTFNRACVSFIKRETSISYFRNICSPLSYTHQIKVSRNAIQLHYLTLNSPEVSPSNSSFNLPWKANSVMPLSAENIEIKINTTMTQRYFLCANLINAKQQKRVMRTQRFFQSIDFLLAFCIAVFYWKCVNFPNLLLITFQVTSFIPEIIFSLEQIEHIDKKLPLFLRRN